MKYIEKRLSHRTDVLMLDEPVGEWESLKDSQGKSILELFYHDTAKYAFSFQMLAFISRLSKLTEALDKAGEDAIVICERSLECDRHVFAQMLKDDAQIAGIDFEIYAKWFGHFTRNLPEHHIVYLRTDPNVAMRRVEERAREGENISLQYLSSCHKYHEQWIGRAGATVLDANVLNTNEVYASWFEESIGRMIAASDAVC